MSINWDDLNKKTADYQTLTKLKSPDGKTVSDIQFSGLQVKLSDLTKDIQQGGNLLAIWADTLIIDYPVFTSQYTIIVARKIDISLLGNSAMPILVPKAGATSVTEFFIGGTVGDAPYNLVTSESGKDTASLFEVPTTIDEPKVAYFYVNGDGSYKSETFKTYFQFKDLIDKAYALNSLKASYAAAVELINQGDKEALETAKSMLRWIITCIGLLGIEGNTFPGEAGELYSQASAIITTLNIKVGAYHVPSLSADYYASQANKLLDALTSFESDLNTLTTAQNIGQAVAAVSENLQKNGDAQVIPLQTDMNNVVDNATVLGESIQSLRGQFIIQSITAQTLRDKMDIEIRQADVKRYLKAFFDVAVDLTKAAVEVGKYAMGDPMASPGDALGSGVSAIQNVYKMYTLVTKDYTNDTLVEAANKLAAAQRDLAFSFLANVGIWGQLKNNKPITQWPVGESGDAIDAEMVWNNYQIEAERVLTNLNRSLIGNDDFSDAAQEAATNYLAALKVLIQYGKAVNLKMVAYSQMLSRAIIIKSEINANKKIQENWESLKNKANTDIEKLAGLKGLLKSRMDAIKRSIFVAWSNYRNSYIYLFFKEPPANTIINTSMSAAQIKTAFANVSDWVGKLLAAPSSSDKITLPNENVPITFKFPIVNSVYGDAYFPKDATYACLNPAADGKPATITVSIPRSTEQLVGTLPNKGMLPIWIKEAAFFITGADANPSGNIILDVSTSGSYQNGYPPSQMFNFETTGMKSSYAYKGVDNVYIPWAIKPQVYMTPSPFTQWTLTFDEDGGAPANAWELVIVFKVTFLSK